MEAVSFLKSRTQGVEMLNCRKFRARCESRAVEEVGRARDSQILRKKSFFDDRRKSLFAKKEKLSLDGEDGEEGEVDLSISSPEKRLELITQVESGKRLKWTPSSKRRQSILIPQVRVKMLVKPSTNFLI